MKEGIIRILLGTYVRILVFAVCNDSVCAAVPRT